MIENRRNNAYRKVNEEMILLYRDIGKYLYKITESSCYGDKVLEKVSSFIEEKYPSIKGFTKRNLERMIQFYKIYKDDEIATTLLTQLSWSNHLLIMSSAKTEQERYFYLRMSIKNNYSYRELKRQLDSCYYQRYMLSNGNAIISSEKNTDEDDYPNTKILDTYSLEFLDLPNHFTEKD